MKQQDKLSARITEAARLSGFREGTVSRELGKPIACSGRTRTRVEGAIQLLDDRLPKIERVLSSPDAGVTRSPSGAHLGTWKPYSSLDKFTAALQRNVTSAPQPKTSHP